jgi:acyl dehydratase
MAGGWMGRHFEDFAPGERIDHGVSRTVTDNDNQLFTLLTYNTNLTHTNSDVAAQSEFGRPLMNSTFTMAMVIGMTVRDVSENAVANLGWESIEILGPVFAGDTLYASTEVLGVRESGSRPQAGIVRVRTLGYKGTGEPVMRFVRTAMIWKRGFGPRAHWPQPPSFDVGEK